MRIEQLQYLVEIAQVGSISLAAEKLHSSQPNISYALNAFEEEIGVRVFHRKRGGTEPTEVGKTIIAQAQDILDKLDKLKATTKNHSALIYEQIRIGAVPGVCNSFLPKLLSKYKDKYPNVSLELVEANSDEIEEDVIQGKLNLGLVGLLGDHEFKHLEAEQFLACQLMACVGPESPLVGNSQLSLAEIVQYPLVNISDNIKMELMKYGTPNEIFHSTRTEATKHIISESMATSFYLDISLVKDPYVMMGRILPIPIKEKVQVKLYWIRSRQSSSIATEAFIQELMMNVRFLYK